MLLLLLLLLRLLFDLFCGLYFISKAVHVYPPPVLFFVSPSRRSYYLTYSERSSQTKTIHAPQRSFHVEFIAPPHPPPPPQDKERYPRTFLTTLKSPCITDLHCFGLYMTGTSDTAWGTRRASTRSFSPKKNFYSRFCTTFSTRLVSDLSYRGSTCYDVGSNSFGETQF